MKEQPSMKEHPLYTKYELLLPSKFDGGYLVIALYEKIRNSEIEEYFTQKKIIEILADIKVEFNLESIRPWNTSHPTTDSKWKSEGDYRNRTL